MEKAKKKKKEWVDNRLTVLLFKGSQDNLQKSKNRK